MGEMSTFAGMAVALYAAHHVGDYWVQTDHQARHKGAAGAAGVRACTAHVATYLATQIMCVALVCAVFNVAVSPWGLFAALAVSGGTHYLADRREHGVMFWLARKLRLQAFLSFGVPREARTVELWGPCSSCEGRGTSYDASTGGLCWDCRGGGMLPGSVEITDNPSLGTGSWALDQAWHIFWGVFVAALLLAAL